MGGEAGLGAGRRICPGYQVPQQNAPVIVGHTDDIVYYATDMFISDMYSRTMI